MTQIGSPPLRVLYIGGAARSGSTLLSEMLGAQPATLNIGELSLFWRDVSRGGECACGALLAECQVWGSALKTISITHDVDPSEYASLAATRSALASMRDIKKLVKLVRGGRQSWSPEVDRLVVVTEALIRAAMEIAGARVLVDSSKTVPSLFFHRLTDTDLTLVHLTRDVRGVVASSYRSRHVLRGNWESLPPGSGILRTVGSWMRANVFLILGSHAAGRRVGVSYEELMESPAHVLRGICDLAGISMDTESLIGREFRMSSPSHAAVGNPARKAGTVRTLRSDDRWRKELSPLTARMVRVLAAPVVAMLRVVR